MNRIMFAAPASGSGKTSVTCGMLTVLARRGLQPCAFKCGPDYIDPMFHRSVLGIESHNLDLFLAGRDQVNEMYHRYSAGHGIAVFEGVMGLYDGIAGTTTGAGSWDLADSLDVPVILVIRPKGASLTLAAVIKGLAEFRENSHVAGVILNDCSAMLYKSIAPTLEKESGVPLLGYLPHMEEAQFESRHLGLYTAGEIDDLQARIGALADTLEETVDIDRFLSIAGSADAENRTVHEESPNDDTMEPTARIAVARDEAFCFLYEETLDVLKRAGAELIYFSPLADEAIPAEADALYFPGGYPELHAEALSKNKSMLDSVRHAIEAEIPTVAECGGFLYLHEKLGDAEGNLWPMVGIIDGEATKQKRLVRFGYSTLTAKEDSMLFRVGEEYPVHEFHYWDSTNNGEALHAVKPVSGRNWDAGHANHHLYAGFPHLYLAGKKELAARFVAAAENYRNEGK